MLPVLGRRVQIVLTDAPPGICCQSSPSLFSGPVIIGILSDSHGRTDPMSSGISRLRDAGAELFLHCGDIGGEACIDLLAGLNAAFVWGNTDWERKSLSGYAEQVGVK